MGYPPIATQPTHICQYAAFLARSLKPSSIPNSLNINSILYKEFNLPNPLQLAPPVFAYWHQAG